MANQVTRSIYINSQVWLVEDFNNTVIAGVAGSGIVGAGKITPNGQLVGLPQNASYTLNIPRADVNAFGFDGVVDRPQLEAETSTMEFTFIPQGQAAISGGVYTRDITGEMWADCVFESKAQTPDYLEVRVPGVGAINTSLMNSLSGEINVGALGSMTASFTGRILDADNLQHAFDPALGIAMNLALIDFDTVAAPVPGSGSANLGVAPQPGSDFKDPAKFGVGAVMGPQDIILYGNPGSPVSGAATSALVDELPEPNADPTEVGKAGENMEDSCAQSASFTFDMPVEMLLCLGQDPVTAGIALGNPPGTASITVEALSAQLSHKRDSDNYFMYFGAYAVALLGANIDSRTHNLAVGDLYGTYNYVLGGTGDGFEIGT